MVEGRGDNRSVERADPRLAAIGDVDQLQRGKCLEGLAHHGAADPQTLGEIALTGKRIADPEIGFAHDGAADPQTVSEISLSWKRIADPEIGFAHVAVDRIDGGLDQ